MSFDYGETAYRAVLNDLRILEKENERLRKALTHLTKDPGMFCCDCPDIREFCRDALEGKE